jgi:hypothetical protein
VCIHSILNVMQWVHRFPGIAALSPEHGRVNEAGHRNFSPLTSTWLKSEHKDPKTWGVCSPFFFLHASQAPRSLLLFTFGVSSRSLVPSDMRELETRERCKVRYEGSLGPIMSELRRNLLIGDACTALRDRIDINPP